MNDRIDTLRPRQNGQQAADEIIKAFFFTIVGYFKWYGKFVLNVAASVGIVEFNDPFYGVTFNIT